MKKHKAYEPSNMKVKKSNKKKQKKAIIHRSELAKMIQRSSLDADKKQKLIFELPKMSEEAVKDLQEELEKARKEEEERIHERLEAEMAREAKKGGQLEELYNEMGAGPRELNEGEVREDQVRMTQELLDEAEKDPKKLTAFLAAIGPRGMKQLEKAIERLKADPKFKFSQEEIDDTVSKIRHFSADLQITAQQLDEEFRKKKLIEQIRAEKEKQGVLRGYLKDIDTIKCSHHS